jgi:hypothetical protein
VRPRLPPLPRRPDGRRQRRTDRITVGLAVAALAGAGSVIGGQFGRMLQRRRHERDGGQGLIENAPVAALDTVGVAVEGYSAAPRAETVLFNLLSGFLGSFALVRLSTWGIRSDWWPFGNVRVAGRHIHHFVPGILLAFASGTAGLLTDDEELENRLAVPMGAGMGLTFDEAALLLDLRDVYWSREGLLSVQVSFGAAAMLSTAIITIRMLARGERRQEAAGVIPKGHAAHAPPPIPVG